MASVEITDSGFRDIYQNNDIVVLDFWANWCGPCHQFAPTFEEVSEVFPEIVFGKINTEVEVKLSGYFSVRSIPTIIVIREQLEVFRGSGVMSAAELQGLIKKIQELDMVEVAKKIEEEEGGSE